MTILSQEMIAAVLKTMEGADTGGPVVAEDEDWPYPEPVEREKLKPVIRIPPEIIPAALRPWLTDTAHRMQCPLEFLAAVAIVVISSLVGAGCAIKPKRNDDWRVIPNLWGVIIGRPSTMKSGALAEVTRILYLMEGAAKERFDKEARCFQARGEAHKARLDALRHDMSLIAKKKKQGSMDTIEAEMAALESPSEPKRRRYVTNDTTIEKLGELLSDNPRGLLVQRDELSGLLVSWEREDRQGDRAFYLEAWSGGQSFTTDRIGRGTVDVKNVCVSIIGGIQPSKLMTYLSQSSSSLTNDGAMQRFQVMVYPDEPKSWELVDKVPDVAARDTAIKIFNTLAGMDFVAAGATQEGERPFFRFDEKGQTVLYEWLTELESEIREEDDPLICEHLAKYRKLMPALALLFHLIDVAAGGKPGPVTALAAEMATAWASFLERHARRVYGMIANQEVQAVEQLSKRILAGKIDDRFTERDIYRKGWYLLDRLNTAKACRELEELGWLRREYVELARRQPGVMFRINPKLLPEKA